MKLPQPTIAWVAGSAGVGKTTVMRDIIPSIDNAVLIEKDITGKDRYGRLLRYLKIPSDDPKENDVLVNNELTAGDSWTVCATPNNGSVDGADYIIWLSNYGL